MPVTMLRLSAYAVPIRLLIVVGLCLLQRATLCAQTPGAPQVTSPAPSAAAKRLLDAGTKALGQRPPQIDEAKKQFDSALALADQDHDAPAKIQAWRGLGSVEQRLRHFPAALEYYQKALDLSRTTGNRSAEARVLGSIGSTTYLAGDPIKARPFWEQAVRIYQAIGDRDEAAGYMMNIGIVYDNTGNPKKAIEIYKQVLPLFEQGKKTHERANVLTNIAISLNKLGETRQALTYWQRALPLYQEEKDIHDEANVLGGIGGEYENLGDHRRAQEHYARALKLYQGIGDRGGEAHTLGNIGGSLRAAGEMEKSLEQLGRSVAIAHDFGDPRTEAESLGAIAIVYDRMGRFAEALRAYQQAIPLYEALNNRYALAGLYNNMGFTYSQAHQNDLARGLFQKAIALYREMGDRHGEASGLGGIGGIYNELGDLPQAVSYYGRALAIFRTTGDRASEAAVLGNIGNAQRKQHRYKIALQTLASTETLAQSIGDLNLEANTLTDIGAIYEDTGDLRRARKSYLLSLAPGRASGNRPYLATSLNDLGDTEKRLGLLTDAESHLGQAVALSEQVRADFANLTEAQSLYLADNLKTYHDYLEILLQRHKPEKAFEVAQQTKARALSDLLAGGQVDLSASLTLQEREQETALRHEADQLNLAMVKEGVQNEHGAKKRFAALKARLRATEGRLRLLMDRLYARHPDMARRRPAPGGDWRSIAADVPSDTALLDYIVFSDQHLLLFVVTHRAQGPVIRAYPIEIKQGSAGRLASEFRAACADPRRSYHEAAIRLNDLLIRPAAADLAGKRRLLICPDGVLWDVPFQALLTEVSGGKGQRRGKRFLTEAFEIAYAYSAGSLHSTLTARSRPDRQAVQNSILVFADPDFGSANRFGDNPAIKGQRPLSDPSRPLSDPSRPLSDPSRPLTDPSRPLADPSRPLTDPSRPLADPSRPLSDPSRPLADPSRGMVSLLRGGKIPALPGTRREAQALNADFPNAAIYLGAQAQEDVCKRLAGQYRYLHFATHGFFNDAAPMLSSIVMAQPTPGSRDDGFLTAREVADMKLNADLVVLSACNTARGERRGGEGVVGLTWALFVAGVPAQVVSQWSVNDIGTATLMQRFYAGLTAEKLSKSASLRSAELTLLKSRAYRHPYYWAPFILLGDWR